MEWVFKSEIASQSFRRDTLEDLILVVRIMVLIIGNYCWAHEKIL